MASSQSILKFLSGRMAQGSISSTSLLITLFCDAVTRHGGEIWLGSLIRSLAPLGISERLVRTPPQLLRPLPGWHQSVSARCKTHLYQQAGGMGRCMDPDHPVIRKRGQTRASAQGFTVAGLRLAVTGYLRNALARSQIAE
jgi:hypothetical protein